MTALWRMLGVFAMNTVSFDNKARGFEDFVAIPDLAAGMIGEVLSVMRSQDRDVQTNTARQRRASSQRLSRIGSAAGLALSRRFAS